MISYIIVFTILIAGVIIWQFRSKTHFLRLSSQEFPELTMYVLISKKERKIESLIVRIKLKKDIVIETIKIELISSIREFSYVDSGEINNAFIFPITTKSLETFELSYPFESLKDILFQKIASLHSFRLVLYLQNGKIFKSHELKFDKFWKINRSDSGRYN